jgi:hypothetical protein
MTHALNDVRHAEHADKGIRAGVDDRGCPDAIVKERAQGVAQADGRVDEDDAGVVRDDLLGAVGLEEGGDDEASVMQKGKRMCALDVHLCERGRVELGRGRLDIHCVVCHRATERKGCCCGRDTSWLVTYTSPRSAQSLPGAVCTVTFAPASSSTSNRSSAMSGCEMHRYKITV